MGKAKVISFIKDPHMVFESSTPPRPTTFCPYRVMVEDEEGSIYVRSLSESDINGDLHAEDIISLNYKECNIVTSDVILESIQAWRTDEWSSSNESELDTAEWVLSEFRRANMIDDEMYRKVLEYFSQDE